MKYKYHLSDNKQVKKGQCPKCGKFKCFVYYLDVNNNKAGDQYGKCDRADNCGYILYPPTEQSYQWGKPRMLYTAPQPSPKPETSFIDNSIVQKSLSAYENNTLFKFLSKKCNPENVLQAFERYKVGTTKTGASIFYQIDNLNRVRTGKIIAYKADGHRNKEITPNWVHKALNLNDFNLEQCLFGLHLLKGTTAPIGIVEAEKTAIVASVFLPSYIWLATGGKQNINLIEKSAEHLKGRKVVLFPDLKATNDWKNKADEIKKVFFLDISVSYYLENNATQEDKDKGLDLADYFLKDNSPTKTNTPTPTIQRQEQEQRANENKVIAYVDKNGTLFIPTPPDYTRQFTIYSSIEAYNSRSETPTIEWQKNKPLNLSETTKVYINMKNLTID